MSDDIRATIVDLVLVHGLAMREAGLRVQPNLSIFCGHHHTEIQRGEQIQ